MSDIKEKLALLRAQRDAATDPALRAALDAAIASLEASIGSGQGSTRMRQEDGARQTGGVNFGSGGQYGDISIGDVAGRDIIKDNITVGDITGSSGVAIGRGAQSSVRQVDTGGGDYAEGSIDKRKGTFVSGDQFNMSGNFSGAILNIKSTLTNVSQSIGAAPGGDAAVKAQLQQLIEELSSELQKAPADKEGEAEAVAETAKAAVEQATKEKPNKTLVTISAEGLKAAAQNLAAALPAVLPIATKIAETIQKFVG